MHFPPSGKSRGSDLWEAYPSWRISRCVWPVTWNRTSTAASITLITELVSGARRLADDSGAVINAADSDLSSDVLSALMGADTTLNPRMIVFLGVPTARIATNARQWLGFRNAREEPLTTNRH